MMQQKCMKSKLLQLDISLKQQCYSARTLERVFIVVTSRQSDLSVGLETGVTLAIILVNEA